ncbi:MAG: hypothetical protein JNM17_25780 [Archangium sp.]|nr:hypothetical protein [Archangium sp.]
MDVLLWVLVVVLAVWLGRRALTWVKKSSERRRRAALPGMSADNPLRLTSARVIDDARAALRCECGGRVQELGETSRLGLRVARGRCVECDADVDLYFVLPQMLN